MKYKPIKQNQIDSSSSHSLYQRSLAALLVPVFSAAMYFSVPRTAYAAENASGNKGAAAGVSSDNLDDPFAESSCMIRKFMDPNYKVDCANIKKDKKDKKEKEVKERNLETIAAIAAQTQSAQSATSSQLLPAQPEAYAQKPSQESPQKPSQDSYNTKPKSKSKRTLTYIAGALGVVLLYDLLSDKKSRPSQQPAVDISDADNDACNVNVEVCGGEVITPDVDTSGFTAE